MVCCPGDMPVDRLPNDGQAVSSSQDTELSSAIIVEDDQISSGKWSQRFLAHILQAGFSLVSLPVLVTIYGFGLAPGDHCWQLAVLWGAYLALCGPLLLLVVWQQHRRRHGLGHVKRGVASQLARAWRVFTYQGVGPLTIAVQLSCLALVLGTYVHHRECRSVAAFLDNEFHAREFAHFSYLEAVIVILFSQLAWQMLRRPLVWLALMAPMLALLLALPALSGAKYESWEDLYTQADYQRTIYVFLLLAVALWLLCRGKGGAPPPIFSPAITPSANPSATYLGLHHPLQLAATDRSMAGGSLGHLSRTQSWSQLQKEAREMLQGGGGGAFGAGADSCAHSGNSKPPSGRDALRRLFMADRRLAKTPLETVYLVLSSAEAGSIPLTLDVIRFLQELLSMELHLPMGIQPPVMSSGTSSTGDASGARGSCYRRDNSLPREGGPTALGESICSPERRRRGGMDTETTRWLQNTTQSQPNGPEGAAGDVGVALEDEEGSGHSQVEEGAPKGRRVRELGTASLDLNTLFLSRGLRPEPIPNALEDFNTENIRRMLAKAGTWNFEVVELAQCTGNRPLSAIGYVLFKNLDLISRFCLDESKLLAFLRHMDKSSAANPYHSNVHMADVTSNLFFMLQSSGLIKLMMPVDVLGVMLGALIHDYNHPGVNNDFLRRSHNHLSLLYNDKSPLENHHLTQAYLLLQRPEFNFLAGIREDEATAVRHVVIETVLSSDLKRHFELLDVLKGRQRFFRQWVAAHDPRGIITGINTPPPSEMAVEGGEEGQAPRISASSLMAPLKEQDRLLLLQFALKVADIGHSAKYRSLHLHWCRAIMEEFYAQGDKEKALGLPVSPFMDRHNSNVPKAQLGFYEYIVLPMYETFAYIFPKTSLLVDAAVVNRSFWASLVDAGVKDIPSKVP